MKKVRVGRKTILEIGLLVVLGVFAAMMFFTTSFAAPSWDEGYAADKSYYIVIDNNDDDDDQAFGVFKDGSPGLGSEIELFRIQEDGNVGIGTATPSAVLDVKGKTGLGPLALTGPDQDMSIDGAFIGTTSKSYVISIDSTGTPDTFEWDDDGELQTNQKGAFVAITGFPQNLNYGVTITFQFTTGHSTNSWWGFTATPTNPFTIENPSGTELVFVRNDGNFGIGTTSPNAKLEVAGTIKMTGFEMPTGATNGYVLTTDASGTGTWQAAGGVGGSGNANYIPKFTAASTLDDSVIYETGGNIGIGTTTPGAYKLNVAGNVYVGGNIAVTGTVDGHDISTSATTWASDSSTTNELPQAGDDIDVSTNTVALEDDIDVSYVRASSGSGLYLYDDGSTLGIFIKDGGNVGIGSTIIPANTQLFVYGGNNYDYAAQFENAYDNAGSIGILADCSPSAGTGTGAEIEGGSTGTYSFVNQNGASTYTGVDAQAWGSGEGGTWRGVYARATGTGTTNYGIYAYASGATTDYAGYFQGDITVTGTISKGVCNFKIDHPLDPANKYLIHTGIESPDMMNLYNGNVILDTAGEAWVELPDYFSALNMDFRYQLTPIGTPGPNLYIAEEIFDHEFEGKTVDYNQKTSTQHLEITLNKFKIAGGEPGMKVSWQVTGIRHDRFAEEYRSPVEEFKLEKDVGKYIHPELYGLPENMAIGYFEPENT